MTAAIEPMTNWTKLGQFPGCTELLKWRSSRRRGGRGREGGLRAAAHELGISRTDARRAVHRVDRIAPGVRDALRDSRALTCRLRQCPRPGANEISACATPSHPAVGGPVQPSCVPFCGRIYAVSSVEWAEEQRRLGNSG